MSWQHSPHRRGALLVFSLRQSYLHQNQAEEGSAAITRSMAFPPLWCGNLLSAWPNKTQDRSLECFVKGPSSATQISESQAIPDTYSRMMSRSA